MDRIEERRPAESASLVTRACEACSVCCRADCFPLSTAEYGLLMEMKIGSSEAFAPLAPEKGLLRSITEVCSAGRAGTWGRNPSIDCRGLPGFDVAYVVTLKRDAGCAHAPWGVD